MRVGVDKKGKKRKTATINESTREISPLSPWKKKHLRSIKSGAKAAVHSLVCVFFFAKGSERKKEDATKERGERKWTVRTENYSIHTIINIVRVQRRRADSILASALI